jgi:hypothetical protein
VIVCKRCGHHSKASATFCESCGAYLEWTGERIAEPDTEQEQEQEAAAAAPAAASDAEATQLTGVAQPMTAAPPVAVAAGVPAVDDPQAAAGAARPAIPPSTPVARPPAAPPPPVDPVAVEPAHARARRVARAETLPQRYVGRSDDLICPSCRERNPQERHFCRRCATDLRTAPAAAETAEERAARLSWWRRLLQRLRGHDDEAPADDTGREARAARRAAARDRWSAVRRGVMAVVTVVVVVILLVPPLRTRVSDAGRAVAQDVRRLLAPTWVEVHPSSATDSAELPGHGAAMAIDGLSDTFWAAPFPGAGGAPPLLTVFFSHPMTVEAIGFTIAAPTQTQQYLAEPRPHQVHVVFSDASTQDLQLADTRSFQSFRVGAHQVTSIAVEIATVWTGQAGNDVTLAEIEFYQRQ